MLLLLKCIKKYEEIIQYKRPKISHIPSIKLNLFVSLLPNDKILDMSKFLGFADEIFKFLQKW